MTLTGANQGATVSGVDQLPSHSNYFIGNNPSKWYRDVPHYARVRYQQVYPGVDLVYYGNQGRLEYDFEVAPGADPGQIRLHIEGARKLRVDGKGNLLVQTAGGEVQLQAPEVYQKQGDQKQVVAGKFVLSADNQVRFAVGDYDRGRELVIDPALNYSTYLGGTGNEGCAFLSGTYTTAVSGCPAIATDTAANIYVAGTTTSTDFPVLGSPYQATNGGLSDVFIAKFTPNAGVYSLADSTYLGGAGTDTTAGIAVDFNQNIYVAGNTSSTNFPTTSDGNQTTPPSGGTHGFVSVLDKTASNLIYSSYVEGTGTADTITGLAIDSRANAYVTGTTDSDPPGFPITSGAIQTTRQSPANPQFFLVELNTASTGTRLMYGTYFGSTLAGTSPAIVQGGGVAVDASGAAYITGGTNFLSSGSGGNFPILNAYQPCLDAPGAASCGSTVPTNADAFVAKIDTTAASGAQLKYSTYLGGTGVDVAYGIAVDSGGNAYITGSTDGAGFPITSATTAFQPTYGGGATDAFVAKIGSVGNTLAYSSYLGGTGNDVAYAIAVDVNQGAHVAGATTGNFPQIQPIAGTGPDTGGNAFVALLQTTFSGLTGGYSSYLGPATSASGNTDATGIATDSNANTFVTGETDSATFPVTNNSFLNGNGSTTASDAFVSKVVPQFGSGQLTLSAATSVTSGSSIGIGNQVTFTYTINNASPEVATNLIFTDALGTGATFVSASATPGSCTAVVNGTVTCSLGSLGAGTSAHPTTATVKINLTPTVAGSLANTGSLQVDGALFASASTTVPVTDFVIAASPATNAVLAGNSATYQVRVGVPAGQTTFDPNQISLSCSAGVPTGAACTFSTNPLTLTNTSAVSSTLTITTTARPVTAATSKTLRTWYAVILPITGLTFLGIGVGGSRRKKWSIAIFAVLAFALAGLQLACSSGSRTTTPPAGTPAGTYAITLTGTSGSASHATGLTLVVQ